MDGVIIVSDTVVCEAVGLKIDGPRDHHKLIALLSNGQSETVASDLDFREADKVLSAFASALLKKEKRLFVISEQRRKVFGDEDCR